VHTLRVEQVPSSFTRFESLRHLDLDKLRRTRRTTVDLGYLTAGHCRQLVTANVANGVVTRIDLEPCAHPNAKRPSPDIVRLVRKARAIAIRRARPGPFRPRPIAEVVRSTARIIIETITCFRICLDGLCIYCCTKPQGGLVCGAEVVVLPPIIIDF
jgi:hypothetical protein